MAFLVVLSFRGDTLAAGEEAPFAASRSGSLRWLSPFRSIPRYLAVEGAAEEGRPRQALGFSVHAGRRGIRRLGTGRAGAGEGLRRRGGGVKQAARDRKRRKRRRRRRGRGGQALCPCRRACLV